MAHLVEHEKLFVAFCPPLQTAVICPVFRLTVLMKGDSVAFGIKFSRATACKGSAPDTAGCVPTITRPVCGEEKNYWLKKGTPTFHQIGSKDTGNGGSDDEEEEEEDEEDEEEKESSSEVSSSAEDDDSYDDMESH